MIDIDDVVAVVVISLGVIMFVAAVAIIMIIATGLA